MDNFIHMIRKKLSKLLKKITFSSQSKNHIKGMPYPERNPLLMPSEMIRLRNQRKRLGKD